MNNRPDWVDLPLEGLREIAGGEVTVTTIETASGAPREVSRGPTPVPVTKPSPTHPAPVVTDRQADAIADFAAGRATHAHAYFGAHPREDGGATFTVWAPHASRVDVVGEWNDWKSETAPLTQAPTGAVFTGRVRGARPGHLYKYRITPAGGGAPFDKADPFAVMCEPAPGNASIIASLDYRWKDEAWMSERARLAALGNRPDEHLRGAPRLLASRARGGEPCPRLPRDCRAARRAREGAGLHARRADAAARASLLRLVGLRRDRVLRRDEPLRLARRSHVPGRYAPSEQVSG